MSGNALAKIDIGAVTPPLQQDGVSCCFRRMANAKMVRLILVKIVRLARSPTLPRTCKNADRLEAAARLERDTAGVSNCPDFLTLQQLWVQYARPSR